MLEIPETYHLAKQINSLLINKKVKEVIVNKHQHKMHGFMETRQIIFKDFRER